MKRQTATLVSCVLMIGVIIGLSAISKRSESTRELDIEAHIRPKKDKEVITEVETNLDTPWEIAVMPDGKILVSERKGVMHIVGETQKVTIPEVSETKEGGLLGIALHPKFKSNNFIYVYFTTRTNGALQNKVVRYLFDGTTLQSPTTILEKIPAGEVHNGGRIAFGPDENLYITTGEAGNPKLAQNKQSLGGKILRVKDDGSIPKDNPFENFVYSYGHRNPQGLAWDSDGGLWSTEHGRSGALSGYDEVNYIEKGGNYGWPDIEGDKTKSGMIAPIVHSGATTTWAPASLAILNGKLYFAGLKGKTLYEVPLTSKGTVGEITELYKNVYGRLRTVTVFNKDLLVSTSNKDGRGTPLEGDDKIIKIHLGTKPAVDTKEMEIPTSLE